MATIQTVLGPIPAEKFGVAVPHEHVMVDFVGADKTGRHRWHIDDVAKAMRPRLEELKRRGVAGLADCTPAYLGRDPRLLKRLAQETGLHILTNTGYYGGADDKFVPKHAYTETDRQLADRWTREWEKGIERTGVKPGFVKIGVDEVGADGKLSGMDAKLVRAAALVSRKTGLAVTCHTGGGPAGLAAARLFVEQEAKPSRFIVAHSDDHGIDIQRAVATLGSWVSIDGIGWRATPDHLPIVLPLLERHADRVLLSMDSGWWWVGEPGGGKIRPYLYLTDDFLPALKKAGVADAMLRKLTVENPASAFAIDPPA